MNAGKRLLRKYKYPPDGQEEAVARMLEQAEAMAGCGVANFGNEKGEKGEKGRRQEIEGCGFLLARWSGAEDQDCNRGRNSVQ